MKFKTLTTLLYSLYVFIMHSLCSHCMYSVYVFIVRSVHFFDLGKLRIQGRMQFVEQVPQTVLNRVLTLPDYSRSPEFLKSIGYQAK